MRIISLLFSLMSLPQIPLPQKQLHGKALHIPTSDKRRHRLEDDQTAVFAHSEMAKREITKVAIEAVS